MKRIKIFILIFFLLSAVFYSCKKQNEKKIEGSWLEVETRNLKNDSISEEWSFRENSVFFLTYNKHTQKTDSLWKGDYKIKANPFRRKLIIENSTQPEYEGEWEIEKLTKDYLVLAIQKGGLLYKEFQKK